MKPINKFLLDNALRITDNPCVSPDFCIDWEGLQSDLASDSGIVNHDKSGVSTSHGAWSLVENRHGDHAWRLTPADPDAAGVEQILENRTEINGHVYFPASFENLIRIKNVFQEADSNCTIFPSGGADLGKSTLGIGARFTTLHWDGVDWAMSRLGQGLTANQNSIPRELVYDVDEMLADRLDSVPFPFIGCDVPEGHQGQSVEGMTHGCILAKLKSGFHKLGLAWSFNADHQPIGGKFDIREDQLVAGCLFASYITFDISPELALTEVSDSPIEKSMYVTQNVPADLVEAARLRVEAAGLTPTKDEFNGLLAYVWPAMQKMKARDDKYRSAREAAFTTKLGRDYLRELSIDELPGLTTPETTAVMLVLAFEMGMPIHFIAPAFGFQKNIPYPDNDELRSMVARIWSVCEKFGVSIGFHSGSGKSAENYQVVGEMTGSRLEIKTSGRYTYEMGVALHASTNESDQALWRDWHAFTLDLAVAGCFAEDDTERKMAREFVSDTLSAAGANPEVYVDSESCRVALQALEPSPDHVFWFE
ncbi:MAG: tagaturonate epimerase family protein, partial [Opitutales bacterium]